MTSKVRAKFRVTEKNQSEHGFSVKLWPVTGGSEENEEFFRYTPEGGIDLTTINPTAAAAFEVGREYYIDFTPAD